MNFLRFLKLRIPIWPGSGPKIWSSSDLVLVQLESCSDPVLIKFWSSFGPLMVWFRSDSCPILDRLRFSSDSTPVRFLFSSGPVLVHILINFDRVLVPLFLWYGPIHDQIKCSSGPVLIWSNYGRDADQILIACKIYPK